MAEDYYKTIESKNIPT